MTTINTVKCELLFVEVESYCSGVMLARKSSQTNYEILIFDKNKDLIATIPIPEGKYKVIGFTDELTEEHCKDLVKSHIGFLSKRPWYCDYINDTDETNSLRIAHDSFKSILTANHITGRHIVLRKKD